MTRRRATTAPAAPRTPLREARQRNALLREQIAEKRLTRQARLMESAGFWVEPYAELMNRLHAREFASRPLTTRYDRRFGRDYPLYQNEQELALLRQPARVLLGTNSYAQGMARGMAGYVLGKKSDVRAACDDVAVQTAAQKVLDAFLRRNDWYGGHRPSLERELYEFRRFSDGEYFLTHHLRADGTTDVRVQDPEQCTIPPGQDFREWGFGVYADPDDPQLPLAYWFVFGDTPHDGLEFDGSLVVHYKGGVGRGMKRGVPAFSFDAYDQFAEAGRLIANMGGSAVAQASIAAVREHTGADVDKVQSFVDGQTDFRQIDYLTRSLDAVARQKPGQIQDMGDNSKYVAGPIAANGQTHLAILSGLLRAAGTRLNIPDWVVAAAMGNNDYATQLSASSAFVRSVWAEQGQVAPLTARSGAIALEHWCRTRGLEVLADDDGGGVARTLTWDEVKRLVEVECEMPDPQFEDPLQQTQKRAIEHQAGVLSVQTWQRQEGLDPEKEQANIDEYRDRNPDLAGVPLSADDGFGGGVPNVRPSDGEEGAHVPRRRPPSGKEQ